MRKAPEAFRTISEAAEVLDTPAHVLRFWESKFTQVKPVKRAGGRRYYRPGDIDLLSGIKLLLHDQGMTIRGVQKLLQEKGARHVAAMAPLSGEFFEAEVIPLMRAVPDPAPQEHVLNEAEAVSPDTLPSDPPAEAEIPAAEQPPDLPADLPQVSDPVELIQPAVVECPERAPSAAETPEQRPEAAAEPVILKASDSPVPVPVSEKPASSAPTPSDMSDPEEDLAPSDQPAPALAALLDAAATERPAAPLRFAKIAHALRTAPPKDASAYAATLTRLEELVRKLTARVD